jgi:membrane glycosyltransferase
MDQGMSEGEPAHDVREARKQPRGRPVEPGPAANDEHHASDMRQWRSTASETSDPHAFGEDAFIGFGDDASLPIETPGGATQPAPAAKDASAPDLVPAELPLDMPEQDFSRRIALPEVHHRASFWVPRAALFAGATLLTAAFAKELYDVLSFVRITPIQVVFLILSTMAFGWIALGSMSAALGFLPLFAEEKADTIELPPADAPIDRRIALLFPVYHENPARIAGVIDAIAEELAAAGRARNFEFFILSDTRGAEAGAKEEKVYAELRRALAGTIEIFYRRRRENTARKAGNIKDWVERWGGAYDYFVILDADSVMTGESLQRLAAAMQRDSKAGLIQTVPRLTGGTTILQRLQQYACNVYGPAVAAGLAFWHRDQGNYWGHNAIIRTEAFAQAAGLPHLPGAAPFGGAILSHDFVEAVLLQRAGWGVHMVPGVRGSYEGLPPNLMDLVVRDRRWAQGNLQHLAIVAQAGLTGMGRLHLIMGAFSYLVSAVWASSLIVGMVLALQGQQILPSYFEDAKTLFPIWPVIDPGAALRLFVATMAVVMLPKALGLALELKRSRAARETGGSVRAVLAVLTETLFSMLLAPILMCTQTTAVAQILAGRDSGWKAQRRDDGSIPFETAFRFHWRHSLIGVVLLLLCWYSSPGLIAWMAPIIVGLILAAPITWLTALPAGPVMSAILSTPEDRSEPPILAHATERAEVWTRRAAA